MKLTNKKTLLKSKLSSHTNRVPQKRNNAFGQPIAPEDKYD